MIRYALTCAGDHGWEAWFDSIASFEAQAARGLVECPVCASRDVRRAPMAPAVVTRASGRGATPLASVPDSLDLPPEVRSALDALRETVATSFDHVGPHFAREARAIHEGESPQRPIYGEATPQEARALVEDGIPVAPLPALAVPRDPGRLN